MQVDTSLVSVKNHVCLLLASLSYVFFNLDDCLRVFAIKLAVLMMLSALWLMCSFFKCFFVGLGASTESDKILASLSDQLVTFHDQIIDVRRESFGLLDEAVWTFTFDWGKFFDLLAEFTLLHGMKTLVNSVDLLT